MLHSPSTTTSDGPSSSSSTSFGIMPTAGDQSDQQYDIPWEFKNRALAAVLGQQNFQKSPEQNAKNGNANGGGKAQQQTKHDSQRQCQNVRKRLSLPHGIQPHSSGAGGGQPAKEQRARRVVAPGTVCANGHFQFIQPIKVDPARIDHPPKDHPPPPLLSSPSCSSSGSSSSRTHQPQKPPIRQVQNVQSPGAQHHQLRNYPMVAMPTSPSAKEVIAFCQQHQRSPGGMPPETELDQLVHHRLDRGQAEHLLGPMGLGAHLLRKRPDGNLALSLRATEGVLHIKLEFRHGQWVLGDGPRFPSVPSMLRAYRRTELPVRGAEQIRLGVHLRPTDVPGGLLLL